MDLVLSIVLMILISPIFVIITVILAAIHRGSPFFIQNRALVLERNIFRIYKFKTFSFQNHKISTTDEVFRKKSFTKSVNVFCALLRKTGLDEIPQLLNVLLGDMSFIGPRPFSLTDLEIIKSEFPALYKTRVGLQAQPGISGLWQIKGDREQGIQNLIELELEYVKNQSLITDLTIMAKTLPIILFASHSDAYIGKKFLNKRKTVSKATNRPDQNEMISVRRIVPATYQGGK